MRPLSETEIRASFVNCSKGEASRIRMPADLSRTPWADLDFLGWADPGAPLRTLLVVPDGDGVTGLVLRRPESRRGSAMRSSMCRVCHTEHSSDGVTLFADLACSLYLRGKRQPRGRLVRHEETLTVDEKVERAMAHLVNFTRRVTGVSEGPAPAHR